MVLELVAYCCYLYLDKQDNAEPWSNGYENILQTTPKGGDVPGIWP